MDQRKITQLTPKAHQPDEGWLCFKWRPVKNLTWNFWASKGYSSYRPFGLLIHHHTENCCGHGCKSLGARLCLVWWSVEGWVAWGHCVSEKEYNEIKAEQHEHVS